MFPYKRKNNSRSTIILTNSNNSSSNNNCDKNITSSCLRNQRLLPRLRLQTMPIGTSWMLTISLMFGFFVIITAIDEKSNTSKLMISPEENKTIHLSLPSSSTSRSLTRRDEIYIDDDGIEGSGHRGGIHDDLEKEADYSGSGFGPDDEDSIRNHHNSKTHHSSSSSSSSGGHHGTGTGIQNGVNINSINNREDIITNRNDPNHRINEHNIIGGNRDVINGLGGGRLAGSGDGIDVDDNDDRDHDDDDDSLDHNIHRHDDDHDKDDIDDDDDFFTEGTNIHDHDDDKSINRLDESDINKDKTHILHSGIDIDIDHTHGNSPTNHINSGSGTNEVLIMNTKNEDRAASFFSQPGILAAIIGGAVVGLLCAILVVMFIVYRMRKKDEGSYALDEPKRSPAVNSYAKNANNREFYA